MACTIGFIHAPELFAFEQTYLNGWLGSLAPGATSFDWLVEYVCPIMFQWFTWTMVSNFSDLSAAALEAR
jgi:hypothetical protein